MSSARRMTWYERQQRRKSSPFLRLLDRSFSFRLMLAALLAFVLLAAVNRFQNCHASKFSEDCLETNFWAIVSISNVESFSIVTAALLYILENKQRQQEQHREALDIVMTSQAAGAVLSFGRIRALETLNQAGLWLDGINLQGANLEQLEAPYGRWRGVNLSYTTLMKANFYQTDLSGANLTDANLTEANLNGADLTDADLTRANLTNADLRSANLTRTKLADANLTRTKLDPVLAYSHE